MGDLVTLSDLQLQVQQRADVINQLGAYPLSYLTEQINKGWRRFYGLLCETGEDYLNTTFLWSSQANVLQYYTTANANVGSANVLPTDMFKIRGIDAAALTPGCYEPLERGEFEERCEQNNNGGWPWPWERPRYLYLGSGNTASILFTGTMQAAIGLRLWYFPVPPTLAANTDTIDAGNAWDTYVVDWAARRVAEKDENYDLAARLDISIAAIEQRIKVEAANRNAGQASKIRKSRTGLGYGRRGQGFGGF